MNAQDQTVANDNLVATPERIVKNVTKLGLEIARVYKSQYQKDGTLTAELKQTVKTITSYPSKSVSNNMQDNIFGTQDFGFESTEYENNEVRVAWIDVPLNSNEESVLAQLNKFPNATLYKVLSNKPILNDSQVYAIEAGITSKDAIGDAQAVRYPASHPEAGSLVLDPNGKIQYRVVCFKTTAMEDIDARTESPEDAYLTAGLTAEMAEVAQRVI